MRFQRRATESEEVWQLFATQVEADTQKSWLEVNGFWFENNVRITSPYSVTTAVEAGP